MSKTHSAAKCQAKNPANCPYHGTGETAAVNNQDVNAFIDAKEASKQSSQMVVVGKKAYNAETLIGEGYDAKRVKKIFSRPIGDSNEPAGEKQKSLRIACMVAERDFETKYDEIVNKKFPMLTTRDKKQKYYDKALNELDDLQSKVVVNANASLIAEQTKPWSYTKVKPGKTMYAYMDDGPWEMPDLPEQKGKVVSGAKYVELHNRLQREQLLPLHRSNKWSR